MRTSSLAGLGLAWALALTAAAQVPPADAPPGAGPAPADTQVVARVDDYALTVGRFNRAYVQHLIRTGRNDAPATRWAFLDGLIQTRLLAGEARRRGLDDAPDFRAYETLQTKQALADRFFLGAMADSLRPLTDADVREAFRRSKEDVVLRHLFFRDPAEAEAAYARLQAGEDFLALANEVFKTAAFDSSAGLLGTASYWDLDDAVAEAAYALPVGGVSRPVRSDAGWHVLRVEARRPYPLLTESEYQYRREGTAGKLRLRRNRLAGNAFVRAVMEELDVQVEAAGMALLAEAVDRVLAPPPEDEPPRVALTEDEVAGLRDAAAPDRGLTPETPLLTYTLDGERRTFTALDFYGWLPEMERPELRRRPAAAVGRALRNEVFARRAVAEGLLGDPQVEEAVDYFTGAYLANRLREALPATDPVEPTEAQVRDAYERLGYRRLRRVEADYWTIPFASRAAAEAALEAVRAGRRAPEAFDGYTAHAGADLTDATLESDLVRMPLGTPGVACAGPTCYVAQVDARTPHYTPLDAVEDDVRARLARLLPEVRLLERLYADADVLIDEALFRRMMDAPGAAAPADTAATAPADAAGQ